MKIVLNKKNLHDTCEYLRDIVDGIKKKANSVDSKETKKKMVASLMIISTFLTTGTVAGARIIDKLNNNEDVVIDLPIEEKDLIVPTLNTNPGPILAPTIETEEIKSVFVKEDRNNLKKPETLDDAIKLYSSIFEVKEDIIKEKVYDLINKNKDDFYNNNILNGKEYSDMNKAIFFTTQDIVYHPKKYNLTDEKLKSNIDFDTDLKAEEIASILADYYDVNPFFAVSIMYTECGPKMNSKDWKVNNNPAGIGPHNKFRNKVTGEAYFFYILSNNYGIDNYSGIDELMNMSATYCTAGTDNWRKNVKYFYNELTTKGLLSEVEDHENYIVGNITYDEYLQEINNNKTR